MSGPVAGEQRQILLARLPDDGGLSEDHFAVVRAPVPEPGAGQVLVRTLLLSIDAANRTWMDKATYRPQLVAGDVMAGYGLGEVVDANGTELTEGTVVFADLGWQELAAVSADQAMAVTISGELTHQVSVHGVSGMAAYFGTTDVGRVAPGETFVVSAAAGATGHLAGQIARILGARVVGITGSDEKNLMLESYLGFDATVNHRSASFAADLKAACPEGVDVYFDNVGGRVLETVLRRMNTRGRVVCCGVVSHDPHACESRLAEVLPGVLISRRIRMEGFIVMDETHRWPSASLMLGRWLADGRLKPLENPYEGLDQAPRALLGLLEGANSGKTMVRVGG
ncbi:NADP-dependent oxidoreductase [Nocardioides acrostichi]|uniref:NADP-dependent oxidoreductase n=1 Tax=Nocardioides acrostichi TaxID=2784339 RepID=A0A930UXK2_9ACTN|nr:NADP-dependent oxidoreductase [Nocardioides acrostichi]MBF4162718.1 NADP-dependent oxidoreductase [Nocardioides acrostichi]